MTFVDPSVTSVSGSRPEDGVPDMTVISDIDEAGINRTLHVRYDHDRIYVSFSRWRAAATRGAEAAAGKGEIKNLTFDEFRDRFGKILRRYKTSIAFLIWSYTRLWPTNRLFQTSIT